MGLIDYVQSLNDPHQNAAYRLKKYLDRSDPAMLQAAEISARGTMHNMSRAEREEFVRQRANLRGGIGLGLGAAAGMLAGPAIKPKRWQEALLGGMVLGGTAGGLLARHVSKRTDAPILEKQLAESRDRRNHQIAALALHGKLKGYQAPRVENIGGGALFVDYGAPNSAEKRASDSLVRAVDRVAHPWMR